MAPRALATDTVVLLDGRVVLLERDHDPHEGEWVLPGGLVERDERAHEACIRETNEETGLDVEPVSFVGLYDAPDRDARGNVSAAFLCRPTAPDQQPDPGAEARAIETFDPDNLPSLGFDHDRIVTDALTLYPVLSRQSGAVDGQE